MMLHESLIRAVVLSCMMLGIAYVSADGALMATDCSDHDFAVCMDGWECQEDIDCEEMIGASGEPCIVAEAKCEWHILCLGNNPRLTCTYGDEPN